MDKISVIVPCYNEEEVLPLFHQEVTKELEKIENVDYEILFIDDGSSDHTISLLKDICAIDDHCNYYSFSRNFGKESALLAGLRAASGDYIATMDADLQDPPVLLPQMYDILLECECDNVATYRTNRKGEPRIRSFFARAFYPYKQSF